MNNEFKKKKQNGQPTTTTTNIKWLNMILWAARCVSNALVRFTITFITPRFYTFQSHVLMC